MITAYRRSEVAKLLKISQQYVPRSKEVIKVNVWSARSKKYVVRYLLIKELNDVWLIKERVKKETW